MVYISRHIISNLIFLRYLNIKFHHDTQHNETRHVLVTLDVNDTQYNNAVPLSLVSWFIYFIYSYAIFHYAEYHNAECHNAECRGTTKYNDV
jgi:hypothetical protein